MRLLLIGLTLLLSACGGGSKVDNSSAFDLDFSNLKPYVANGPYANVLARCVAITKNSDSCTLKELPPIGFTQNFPDDNTILNHLVVSHTWMGDRFAEYLTRIPDSVRYQLRATTAIVIDDDIRPAHYKDSTGAIYLDPALLWLTNTEKQTINTKQDFRSDFGKDLQFKRTWRYILNGQYAWNSYSLTDNQERTLDDIVVHLSWLLMHELAHANDCIAPDQLSLLDSNESFYQNVENQKNKQACLYQQLASSDPLQSQEWLDLAQVLFAGVASNATQRALTPEQVGADFGSDIANDTYNYSSVREDVAMNYEEAMMRFEYGSDRDVVILPMYDQFDCNTVLIKWGQRGRLGDLLIKTRAKFVVDRIIPEIDTSSLFNNWGAPMQLPIDESYCRTDYSTQNGQSKKYQSQDSIKLQQRLEHQIEIQ